MFFVGLVNVGKHFPAFRRKSKNKKMSFDFAKLKFAKPTALVVPVVQPAKLQTVAPKLNTAEAAIVIADLDADALERFNERAAIMEYDGGLIREEAERAAAADYIDRIVIADVAVESAKYFEPIAGVVCPWCASGAHLHDVAGGWQCDHCQRLAWWFDGSSIVRSDWSAG